MAPEQKLTVVLVCKLLIILYVIVCSLLLDARYGRVNFVLASRLDLLKEVQRLQVNHHYNCFLCVFSRQYSSDNVVLNKTALF